MADEVKLDLDAGFHEAQGRRESMEDAHVIIKDYKSSELSGMQIPCKSAAFFGVFDGHGGVEAAQMVEKHLPKSIFDRDDFAKGNVTAAINGGFEETDKKIVEESNKNGWMNGSTAVVALLLDHKLHVANVGDSEAILVHKNADGSVRPEALTTPHKASDPNEKRRIESLGGHVFFGRVFGALAVSRSFGDSKFKTPKTSQNFVSWEPATREVQLIPEHQYLVLACDGLWDVMNHQEVAEFVHKHKEQGKTANEVAQLLVREALNKRTEDNVTVIVVYLTWSGNLAAATSGAASSTEHKPDAQVGAHPPANTSNDSGAFPAPPAQHADDAGAFKPLSHPPADPTPADDKASS